MNPWREVLGRIEAGDNAGLVEFVDGLGDVGRRAVAAQLPGHLAERLARGWQERWELRDRAAGYRLAGAACLSGAAQVAAWLNRRELRDVAGRTDAERILRLLRRRPEDWRRDLAVRLVERLRLPRGRAAWRWTGGLPGWHLAAGLVLQTGVEPPANDAFTAGWVLRMAAEREVPRPDDPLLDLMVARLFQATGVAAGLTWSQARNSGNDIVTTLVTMSGDGRLKRQDLLDGCLARFLSGAPADELAPFVAMWRQLAPEAAEIPVLELARLLPSAPPVFAQLALDELRRADQAGLLDGELFGEAVQALAYRPERKHVTAALKWIADTVPSGRPRTRPTTPTDGPPTSTSTATGPATSHPATSHTHPATSHPATANSTTSASAASGPATPGPATSGPATSGPAIPGLEMSAAVVSGPATSGRVPPGAVTSGAAVSRVRAGGALIALATAFSHEAPAVRDRAVRLALKLGARHVPGDGPGSGRGRGRHVPGGDPGPASASGPEHAAEHAADETADETGAPGTAPDDLLTQGWDAVREAATALPDDLRVRVAAVFGEVAPPDDEPSAGAPVPAARPLPALLPPIETPHELADELSRLSRPEDPAVFERILAALVALTHRDRAAVVEALGPWWRDTWAQPFEPRHYAYAGELDRNPGPLLQRCALAVVSPADSRALTAVLDDGMTSHFPYDEPPLQQFIQRRLREVISLFERGGTVPVLLATPTTPTGHVDPETLLARLELLEGAEPLPADLDQALLRLPRLTAAAPLPPGAPAEDTWPVAATVQPGTAAETDASAVQPGAAVEIDASAVQPGAAAGTDAPVASVRLLPWLSTLAGRADAIGTEAGRRLAGWLRAGGLPDPVVRCTLRPAPAVYGETSWDTRITPAAAVPDGIADLMVVPAPTSSWGGAVWWPCSMPSHREIVAAHLLPFVNGFGEPGLAEALAMLVHGDGPLGEATATALATVMGDRRPEWRAAAADALVTLTVRGDLSGFGNLVGDVVGQAVPAGLVKLARVNTVLQEATESGAGTWPVLAAALEVLLPEPGAKVRAGLGDLLATAVRSAVLAGARGDVPGLAALAARKGASRAGEEARRLHHHLTRA
ncbi:DUF6493 family protein [Nonomuraea indica]|uniref:DUF7824 domain-containing protein n=1 Tax=Nonomuraea indica TaxID=1581193 RepID=UPI000C7C8F0A|nr:DUF6493 family protein [Nonomuraea indica]